MPDTPLEAEATLRFNDHTLPFSAGTTLAALLDAQGVTSNQVATAVNGEFVPAPKRASTPLKSGDTVLTFQAIVGG